MNIRAILNYPTEFQYFIIKKLCHFEKNLKKLQLYGKVVIFLMKITIVQTRFLFT